ncbi:hypothetical protein I305_04040 [Cryptococcus gattii E566]|nr:hypothetical protein I305_04040 [Cryptococcus gattii E566]
MEGALGHDIKASTYQIGTDKAYHHLNRSNELFIIALTFRPSDKKAMLGRSRVLIQLAINYHPPPPRRYRFSARGCQHPPLPYASRPAIPNRPRDVSSSMLHSLKHVA